jgi:hypothetical protein
MRIIAVDRPFAVLTLLLTAACLSALPARADNGAAFLEKLSLNSAPGKTLIVCHGFGCAYRNPFVLTPARLSYLQGALGAAHSAKEERKILAQVVAWFDREGARWTASTSPRTSPSFCSCSTATSC